jgi:tartrate-resistant acid phosphatase type 5
LRTIRTIILFIVLHPFQGWSQKFAIVSDIHGAFPATQSVSNLVINWYPDFIITCGDNNYAYSVDIDSEIGQYYHDFISPYTGVFGSGDTINRFFSGLGNHDVEGGGISSYLTYFTLPGNERYYDFVKGYVHFFCINSNIDEPHGVSDTSLQAIWLHYQLATSTSTYNIVYFHHSPYSSGLVHGSNVYMQWPFKQWGASAVFSGHDHIYERLNIGNLPYFVCGTGGGNLYPVNPISGSQFIDNVDHGAILAVANSDSLVLKFINTNDSVIDLYSIYPNTTAKIDYEDNSWENNINVFPNPSRGGFTVSIMNQKQPFSISITDIFGRIVFNEHYDKNNCNFETNLQSIDPGELTEGTYIINIRSIDKVVTWKIVII